MQQKLETTTNNSSGLKKTVKSSTSQSYFRAKGRFSTNSVEAAEAIELAVYYCGRLNILAELLDVSNATIHRGLAGEKVSLETAKRIAAYLEKTHTNFEQKRRVLKRALDSLKRKL
jgi:hypothetical protein